MTMMDGTFWVDFLGWVGAAVLLIAYGLVSTRRVEGDSLRYQGMNIGGSLLLMINTIYYGAYPSAFVNLIWMAIAFYAIRRATRKPLPAGS